MSADVEAAMSAVRAMLAAWDRLDWDGVADAFTSDGVFHPMPQEPIVGREAIRARVAAFGARVGRMDCHIRAMGPVDGAIVTERLDTFTFDGVECALPAAGFFEIENGKIRCWREYFDGATLARVMNPSASGG